MFETNSAVNWENLPLFVKWVAMDNDSMWWGYEEKPEIVNLSGKWFSSHGRSMFIDMEPSNLYWRDTLGKRPQYI